MSNHIQMAVEEEEEEASEQYVDGGAGGLALQDLSHTGSPLLV